MKIRTKDHRNRVTASNQGKEKKMRYTGSMVKVEWKQIKSR